MPFISSVFLSDNFLFLAENWSCASCTSVSGSNNQQGFAMSVMGQGEGEVGGEMVVGDEVVDSEVVAGDEVEVDELEVGSEVVVEDEVEVDEVVVEDEVEVDELQVGSEVVVEDEVEVDELEIGSEVVVEDEVEVDELEIDSEVVVEDEVEVDELGVDSEVVVGDEVDSEVVVGDEVEVDELEVGGEVESGQEFCLLRGCAQRGGDILVADGYRYNKRSGSSFTWRCSRRTRSRCPASVYFCENGQPPRPGRRGHNHPPHTNEAATASFARDLRVAAQADPFRPAHAVVESQLLGSPASIPFEDLPIPRSQKRAVNRARAALRPKDPVNLFFDFDMSFLDDEHFLLADLSGDSYRHLLFATEDGLRDLARSSVWSMDGTFKLVRAPFVQLYSVHSFSEVDGEVRQFPSVFAIMSRRSRTDYELVLR